METIHYKGFTIIRETEPWVLKYGQNFFYYPTESGVDMDNVRWSATLEEAKDEISEIDFLSRYPEQWAVEHSRSLPPAPFDFLEDAMKFAVKWDATPQFTFNAP